MKILVVDDETDLEVLIKQKFRKKIREKEYEFLFAINGVDALEKLLNDPEVDIVLSDINMPEMDGLEFVERLQGADVDSGNVKVLLTTGLPDFVVDLERYPLIVGLLTKPFNLSFIRTTLTQLGLAEKV